MSIRSITLANIIHVHRFSNIYYQCNGEEILLNVIINANGLPYYLQNGELKSFYVEPIFKSLKVDNMYIVYARTIYKEDLIVVNSTVYVKNMHAIF